MGLNDNNGGLALTGSKPDFLESGERLSGPSRLVVMVVGSGSPIQADKSGYSVGSVGVEGGGEVLDVEEDHHVGKDRGHRSIRAIDVPRLQGEHSLLEQSSRVFLTR